MPLPLNPALPDTLSPPVMEARRWLAETPLPAGMDLMNLSQAAPVDPPPEAMRQAMAQAVLMDPSIHLYSTVLGLPSLREALAGRMETIYRSPVRAEQVGLTSGCNQAFCAAVATLAGPGDEIILPTPWYFNHAMWLTLTNIRPVPLPTGKDLHPSVAHCETLITPRTRAIALVSPNNPAGVEYPADLLREFAKLAARHGLALIVDETYRDFHTQSGPPHDLFADPDWQDVFIHLYSFSKAYRLTGHRVGAIATSPARLAQIEKFLDCTTICVSGPGQMAALWGLQNLTDWLAKERVEILKRRAAMTDVINGLAGWDLLGCGAYFAYVRHPLDLPAPEAAREILARSGVLMLPGTMFRPANDPAGLSELRIAFANANSDRIDQLGQRLRNLT